MGNKKNLIWGLVAIFFAQLLWYAAEIMSHFPDRLYRNASLMPYGDIFQPLINYLFAVPGIIVALIAFGLLSKDPRGTKFLKIAIGIVAAVIFGKILFILGAIVGIFLLSGAHF